MIGKRLELKVPPLVWGLACALGMKACAVLLPAYSVPMPFARWFAPILVGLGLSVSIAGVIAIRRAQTTVDPTRPESTSSVVDSGIYGVTRNPIYVGMLIVLVGWGAALGNLLSFLFTGLFVALVSQLQILPEERALEARFGNAYLEYRRRVPRWLFRLDSEDFQL